MVPRGHQKRAHPTRLYEVQIFSNTKSTSLSHTQLKKLSAAISSAVTFPEFDYDRSTRIIMEQEEIMRILKEYIILKTISAENSQECGNSVSDWAQGIALPFKKPYPIYELI